MVICDSSTGVMPGYCPQGIVRHLLLLIILCLFSGAGYANYNDTLNSVDTNDSTETATFFALGTTSTSSITTRIDPAGDQDYFQLLVPSSGTLTIYTRGRTDVYGYLLDSAGNQLAEDDDSGRRYNFRISSHVEAGTYFVQVRHYSSSQVGGYRLYNQLNNSLTSTEACIAIFPPPENCGVYDDGNNSTATATIFALGTTSVSSVSDEINPAGDEDYFKLSVPSSGTLTIYSAGYTDVYGYLLDSSGNELAANDDYGYSRNFRISSNVEAGTYYVRVKHYSSRRVGGYTLNNQLTTASTSTEACIAIFPPPENCTGYDDGNNSTTTATVFALDTTQTLGVSAEINPAGDNDYYRLSVPINGRLAMYTTGYTDVYGYLLDSSGQRIASDDDSASGYNFGLSRNVEAGTYYIQVRHYSLSGTGAYRLHGYIITNTDSTSPTSISDDDGDTLATASNLTLGTTGLVTRTAAIDVPSDNDYFKLIIPQLGNLTVYTTGYTDVYAYLLNSDGVTIAFDDDSGQGLNFRISSNLVAGEYYLKVKHFSVRRTGVYTLNNQFTSLDVGDGSSTTDTTTVDNSGDSDGDSASSATMLVFDVNNVSSRVASIDVAGDNDYFQITVPATGTLTIYSTGYTDVYGYLLNHSSTQLAQNDDGGRRRNFRISETVTPGIYFIRVRAYSATIIGSYRLRISFQSAVTSADIGDSISESSQANINTRISGRIETAGDIDYYMFEVSTPATVVIQTFRPPSQRGILDTVGYLYDSNGLQLNPRARDGGTDDDGRGYNFRITQFLQTGTYYVRVELYNTNLSNIEYILHISY